MAHEEHESLRQQMVATGSSVRIVLLMPISYLLTFVQSLFQAEMNYSKAKTFWWLVAGFMLVELVSWLALYRPRSEQLVTVI